MTMHGNGVIVLRIDNAYSFMEHSSLQAAKAEAHRLAHTVGGRFVVYVPVAIVVPTPQTTESPVTDWRSADDDLPF